MKSLLPIGSVVLLKDSNKRIMIYGRLQYETGTETMYDYVACYYPEGNIGPDKSFLFNHDDIERIYFIGFQDIEEFAFQKMLQENLESLQQGKIDNYMPKNE